jgi:hypothetical protein
MPQYLLSVWHDGDYPTPDPTVMQTMIADVGAFNEALMASGSFVFGGGLMPKESATLVRSVDGDVSMTDGPYAEAKEQMGGFWVIEAADLDVALDWAAKGAAACRGPVEVRPFQDGPG